MAGVYLTRNDRRLSYWLFETNALPLKADALPLKADTGVSRKSQDFLGWGALPSADAPEGLIRFSVASKSLSCVDERNSLLFKEGYFP